jgi:nicotinate-nucleotide adenylyltransferase
MQQSFRRIGILGGTFNQVHYGHLIMAETIRERFELDKVLFIPSGQPPHKTNDVLADAESRYEMVQRAVGSNRFFEASRIEIDREGYTYTIDTLNILKKEYGSETKIFFLIGSDVIPELKTWKEYSNVFKKCEFIACVRPGYDEETFKAALKQGQISEELKISMTKTPCIEISSSTIRERVRKGQTIKYLVPEKVEYYIYSKGLYRNKYE